MKIRKLHVEAVRSTRRTSRVTRMTESQLGSVLAAEGCPDPHLCAIHDYYFSHTVE